MLGSNGPLNPHNPTRWIHPYIEMLECNPAFIIHADIHITPLHKIEMYRPGLF